MKKSTFIASAIVILTFGGIFVANAALTGQQVPPPGANGTVPIASSSATGGISWVSTSSLGISGGIASYNVSSANGLISVSTTTTSATLTASTSPSFTTSTIQHLVLPNVTSSILATDANGNVIATTTSGGSSSLTSTYVGYGSGLNALTGTSTFTFTAGNATATLALGATSTPGCVQMNDSVSSSTPNVIKWVSGVQYSIPSSTCN